MKKKRTLLQTLEQWERVTEIQRELFKKDSSPESVGRRMIASSNAYLNVLDRRHNVSLYTVRMPDGREIFQDNKTGMSFSLYDSGRRKYLKPTQQVRYMNDTYTSPLADWEPLKSK